MKKLATLITGIMLACCSTLAQDKPVVAIQTDAWNVLYAGVDNPITIAAEGIACKDLTIVPEGDANISKGKEMSSFIIRPSGNKKDLTLHVDAKVDGKTKRIASHKYIVKDIPDPELFINGIHPGQFINRQEITSKTVVTPMKGPNFLLEVDPKEIKIVKMIVSNGPYEEMVYGPRFNESIAALAQKAEPGSTLIIQATVMLPSGNTTKVEAFYILGGRSIYDIPVYDKNGKPILDAYGEQVYIKKTPSNEDED